MGYKILSQGVFDGSCFIYSIMNAFKTLFYPDMDITDYINLKPEDKSGKQKWENIISIYPRANEMLAGHPFHEYFLNKPLNNLKEIIGSQFDHITNTAFNILADNDHKVLVKKINLSSIKDNNYLNSVIILVIAKKIKTLAGNEIPYHWICLNGRTENNIHIVCSGSIHTIDPKNYTEYFDTKTNRYYNNLIRLEDINEDILEKGIESIYEIIKL